MPKHVQPREGLNLKPSSENQHITDGHVVCPLASCSASAPTRRVAADSQLILEIHLMFWQYAWKHTHSKHCTSYTKGHLQYAGNPRRRSKQLRAHGGGNRSSTSGLCTGECLGPCTGESLMFHTTQRAKTASKRSRAARCIDLIRMGRPSPAPCHGRVFVVADLLQPTKNANCWIELSGMIPRQAM